MGIKQRNIAPDEKPRPNESRTFPFLFSGPTVFPYSLSLHGEFALRRPGHGKKSQLFHSSWRVHFVCIHRATSRIERTTISESLFLPTRGPRATENNRSWFAEPCRANLICKVAYTKHRHWPGPTSQPVDGWKKNVAPLVRDWEPIYHFNGKPYSTAADQVLSTLYLT